MQMLVTVTLREERVECARKERGIFNVVSQQYSFDMSAVRTEITNKPE